MNKNSYNLLLLILVSTLTLLTSTGSIADDVTLNEKCVINILNRTLQVSDDGGWALPNVPSNMGQIRARATCSLDDGRTVSGQSEYFNIERDGISRAGDIKFEQIDPIPSRLSFSSSDTIILDKLEQNFPLTVTAFYSDNSVKNVTSSSSGINYSSTNINIAEVSSNGVITPKLNGVVLISARKDGVLVSRRVEIHIGGDSDQDGLPDDYERLNGLNPNDPVDALEDIDNDGLSALSEYEIGTDIRNADSDSDGISDKEEIELGEDGFITNPLLTDTDGDRIHDGLEIVGGTDPNDRNSGNLADYLDYIEATPGVLLLTYNAIDGESSEQLVITGFMLDGTTLDLTDKNNGTSYLSADISIANFGSVDGQIFAGENGQTQVIISSNNKQVAVDVVVTEFKPEAKIAINIPGYANNVDIQGDFAFVAAGNSGLQIIDFSDISTASIISSIDTSGTAIDVKIFGDFAYVADGKAGLQIIDIREPDQPKLVSLFNTAGIAQDIALQDKFAYVADGHAGFEIINISNVEKPFSVSYNDQLTDVKGIDVEDNYLVVVGGSELALFDIENKSAPLRLTTVAIGAVKDVVIKNGFIYVAAYRTGYRVYKITDNDTLELKGGDRTFVPRDIAVTNGFAFFAEQLFPNVVAYVNIKDPDVPFFQDTIDLSPLGNYAGTGLALNATHVFITEESYIVRGDYNSVGNTKLFISQYRTLDNLNESIKPEVIISKPTSESIIAEGESIIITADATDNNAIYKVELFIDDFKMAEDFTEPYQFSYIVPFGLDSISLSVKATDLSENSANSENIVLKIQEDRDRDGLGDQEELDTYNTSPDNPDSDNDLLLDGEEIARGTNPNLGDSDGDTFSDGYEVANGTDPTNPDIISPTILYSEPVLDSVDIAENTPIVITFSESLHRKTLTDDVVQVFEDGSSEVSGRVSINNTNQLVFRPENMLKDFMYYTVVVSGVKDSAGNPMMDGYHFNFETGNTIDFDGPSVLLVSPANETNNIPINTSINLTMSEPIVRDSIGMESFFITDTITDEKISGAINIKEDNRTIIFRPHVALLVGRKYKTTVTTLVRDLFGNTLDRHHNSYFTTSLSADTVISGKINVPLNAVINVAVSEAVKPSSIKSIKLFENGIEIRSNISLSNDSKIISINSKGVFKNNTHYSILIKGLSDLSGNELENNHTLNFTTGDEFDTARGVLVNYSPSSQATRSLISSNTSFVLEFNEAVDRVSVNSNNITVQNVDVTDGTFLSGDFWISQDGKTAKFTPEKLGLGNRYRFYVTGIRDLSGNLFRYSVDYGSATGSDASLLIDTQVRYQDDVIEPEVITSNIKSGMNTVPINTEIRLIFNEMIEPRCVNNTTIQLFENGNEINVQVTLSPDRRNISILPLDYFQAGANYELTVNNICDSTGNELGEYNLNFITGSDESPDDIPPVVISRFPIDNETSVSVNSNIVIEFNEAIDATISLDQMPVSIKWGSIIPGNIEVNENIVTFIPHEPFPGETTITVAPQEIKDIAGNICYNCGAIDFKTDSNFDVIKPQIISISPEDGSIDINRATPIVLTFSESLNGSTVNNKNFKIYSDGGIITPDVYISEDYRTVTLIGNWPEGKTSAVIVSSSVADLSGNLLDDFVSIFSSAIDATVRPSVIRQYPLNGSVNSGDITEINLYIDKVMNKSSLDDSFHIVQNGILIQGNVELIASGRVIKFTPEIPFYDNSIIQVYLDNNAKDELGNSVKNYQGNFVIGPDDTNGVNPTPIVYVPNNSAKNVQLNPIIQVAYNQQLDENSLNEKSIYLVSNNSTIPSIITLSENKKIITIKPEGLLTPDTHYGVYLTQIKDLDGESQVYTYYFSFNTGIIAVEDKQKPIVTSMSPHNGAVNVPINPRFHVRFDEAINPLSVKKEEGVNFWFSYDRKEVLYRRNIPLQMNVEHTETIAGIKDLSGNEVESYSTVFTTNEYIDIVAPQVIYWPRHYYFSSYPINATIRWEMNEMIDPVSVNHSTVYVKRNNIKVSGSALLSTDGMTIIWTPSEPLSINEYYEAVLGGVSDLSGNVYMDHDGDTISTTPFKTTNELDVVAPEVNSSSIREGQKGLARNTRISIAMSETITQFSGITLKHSNTIYPVRYLRDAWRSNIIIIPIDILPGNTNLTLSLDGVTDLSGNVMPPYLINFTTGTDADITEGYITRNYPQLRRDEARNTSITVEFSEAIDVVLLNSSRGMDLYKYDRSRWTSVDGTLNISEDRKMIQFKPDDLLEPGFIHIYEFPGSFKDLAGINFDLTPHSSRSFQFIVEDEIDLIAPEVSTSNIENGMNNVATDTQIELSFDGWLSAFCESSSTILLKSNDSIIDTDVIYDRSSYTSYIKIIPSERLTKGTEYELVLEGLCDSAGNVSSEYRLNFTTVNL